MRKLLTIAAIIIVIMSCRKNYNKIKLSDGVWISTDQKDTLVIKEYPQNAPYSIQQYNNSIYITENSVTVNTYNILKVSANEATLRDRAGVIIVHKTGNP